MRHGHRECLVYSELQTPTVTSRLKVSHFRIDLSMQLTKPMVVLIRNELFISLPVFNQLWVSFDEQRQKISQSHSSAVSG